jgi:ADP-ribose pyrophosphatase
MTRNHKPAGLNETKSKASEWQITHSSPAHENPYFSVLQSDVIVPGGEHRDYYTISFPRPAVGVIARRGEQVLLIHQYRFIVDEFVWAIPSGGASDSETLASAALRELEEETGYTAAAIAPFMHCYASYGCSNQRFEIFLAENLRKLDSDFDRSEVLDTRWFSRTELLALIEQNGIVDNLSLSPLLLLLLRDMRA